MRLKKIQLFGFKSFADKTELLFNEGVTCVVGPNGCGKSNISDAIRWVLGERSAKLLRGSKMEDVIFNGTEFRKPLALAEVSLTIDNPDRGLPIDYQEVTLTRRLYRSGESEYLINKTPCRLKDIEDLILDTGIGSSSYSMIEQGRIDYILNADADERRFLIEEAAGISKYKVKKEEALRKLERTEENRLRLQDIIHEVHKNIQYAERQARRAAKYRDELEKLKKLEITKAFFELGGLRTEQSSLHLNRSFQKAEMDALENKIAESRREQESQASSVQGLLENFRGTELKKYTLTAKREQQEQLVRFHREQRLEMANRRGQVEQEIYSLTERLAQSEQEIRAKRRDLELLESERQTAFSIFESAEASFKNIQEQIDYAKNNWERIKEESFEAASQTSSLRNESHRLQALLETGREQRNRQESHSVRIQQEASHGIAKKDDCEKEIRSLEQKLGGLASKKEAQRNAVLEINRLIEKERENTQGLQRKLQDKQARLAALTELHHTAEADERVLLDTFEELERKVAKTLREVFSVRPGFEWALDAALESFARSIIVDDLEAAQKLLLHLRERKSFPVGLLIRRPKKTEAAETSMASQPVHSGILCPLKDVLTIHEGYEEVFEPFFRSTYIASSLPSSEILKEYLPLAWENRLLTKEGIVLGPEGRIFYHDGRLGTKTGSFSQQAEMEEIGKEILSLEQQIANLNFTVQNLQQDLEKLSAGGRLIENEVMETALRKESLDSLRKGLEERSASWNREIDLIRFETEEIQTQENELEAKKQELGRQLAAAQERENLLRQEQEEWGRKLDALDASKNEELKNFAKEKTRLEHFEERLRLLQDSLQMVIDHEAENRRQRDVLSGETLRLQEKDERICREDQELSQVLTQDQENLRELETALELLKRDKEKAETILSASQKNLQELLQQYAGLKDKWHQFEMKGMDLSYQERTLHEKLEQAYRVRLSDLNPKDFPMGEETTEKIDESIARLKERVESLGTVNLLAIEEYEELKKRYDFLIAQQKDLDDAREQLLETIRKINRTTKDLFEQTFTQVQQTFQEYYQTLFRGGQAKLVLIDESHPLESGIDIMVRPPGKKLQHISLLSGGEKALTAIALLFALFKIKPSPFCVLDEVDAPLDEANIDRFLTVLETFLSSSQFIIVTHNRKTIAMGDSLYGVTMEEPGISKIVSVKVSSNVPAPAAKTEPEMERQKGPLEEEVPV